MTKALDIILKDVDYSRVATSYDLPVKQGCVGWWFLGGSVARSVINLADGFPDAVAVGETLIDVENYFLNLEANSHFLKTQAYLGAAWTLVVVCRTDDDLSDGSHQPTYLTTFGHDSGGGIYNSSSALNTVMISYQAGPVGDNQSVAGSGVEDWRMMIASATHLEQTIADMTAGTANTEPQSPLGGSLIPSAYPVSIGGTGTPSSHGGTCQVAMAAIYNRALTEDERDSIYERVKAYFAPRGIAI